MEHMHFYIYMFMEKCDATLKASCCNSWWCCEMIQLSAVETRKYLGAWTSRSNLSWDKKANKTNWDLPTESMRNVEGEVEDEEVNNRKNFLQALTIPHGQKLMGNNSFCSHLNKFISAKLLQKFIEGANRASWLVSGSISKLTWIVVWKKAMPWCATVWTEGPHLSG